LHGLLVGFAGHNFKMSGSPGAQQGQEIHGTGFFLGQTADDILIAHLVKKMGNVKIPVSLNDLVK
jgi:hypothetical protein